MIEINADVEGVSRAVEALRRGEVVAVTNETVYGLACDAANRDACEAICELKGRASSHILPVQVAKAEPPYWNQPIPAKAKLILDRFTPGPITVILPGDPALAPQTRAANGTVGLRLPAHPVMHALTEQFGAPVACTSANPTGEPPAEDLETVRRYFPYGVAILLYGEPKPQGLASTVVDVTSKPPTILREGTIDPEEIYRCLRDLPGSD